MKRYLRPLPIMLCLSIFSVSSISLAAVVNYMDMPTFITSFTTKQVNVSELQQGKLQPPIIFIDVRTSEEYAEDRIGGSLLIPLADIQNGIGIKQIQEIATNPKIAPQKPTIVLYCTKGPRSIKAYKMLEKTGLNLVVLKGGITAWREAVPPEKDAQILGLMNGITFIVQKF